LAQQRGDGDGRAAIDEDGCSEGFGDGGGEHVRTDVAAVETGPFGLLLLGHGVLMIMVGPSIAARGRQPERIGYGDPWVTG
jgi:hypothetical protein